MQTGPRHHPATAIIFVGSLLTLVFGVLNLIVAVDAWMNSCGCGVQQIGKGCDTDSNLWQSVRVDVLHIIAEGIRRECKCTFKMK